MYCFFTILRYFLNHISLCLVILAQICFFYLDIRAVLCHTFVCNVITYLLGQSRMYTRKQPYWVFFLTSYLPSRHCLCRCNGYLRMVYDKLRSAEQVPAVFCDTKDRPHVYQMQLFITHSALQVAK